MIKNILLIIVFFMSLVSESIGQNTSQEDIPKIKKIDTNKIENSFIWALVNKRDTIRIIKTYDGGTEFSLSKKFTNEKLRFITYQLEDFGSGALTTIFYNFILKKFYSLKYNLTGLENEKLIFSSVNFQKRKISLEIHTKGDKKTIVRNLIVLKPF